jgi:hypothetical protein
MVSRKGPRSPAYSLDDIRALAEQHRIRYEGRKVYRDIANLGYTLDDVARCIAGLRIEHFRETVVFENATFDVYLKNFHRSQDLPPDRIFMKLRLLDSGELEVGIGSFHV